MLVLQINSLNEETRDIIIDCIDIIKELISVEVENFVQSIVNDMFKISESVKDNQEEEVWEAPQIREEYKWRSHLTLTAEEVHELYKMSISSWK